MGLFGDDVNTTVDGRPVRVQGRTGAIRATWQLLEGDTVLAEHASLGGECELVGTLSTGTEVRAIIGQGVFGPTTVRVVVNGETVAEHQGFVA
ncbi:hypothetical protein [Brevibacterium ihuae]|uniref:hypothetical protein n=1 Tax=Brevibacterium ihuae TaxID=1631743 RepID=UPI000C7950A8|nr:hypothetical protein [Brevibacterium ihuae]